MAERDANRWDGPLLLGLLVTATSLSWLFVNPFIAFIVIFAVGAALLTSVEYIRRRWRRPGPDRKQ
ncbi:MAG: hypothetical protein ABIG44_06885 [Planctomycetota bacterium]